MDKHIETLNVMESGYAQVMSGNPIFSRHADGYLGHGINSQKSERLTIWKAQSS